MNPDTGIVHKCMHAVAETGVDISPTVYTTFLQHMPEARDLLAIMDERMKGRMLDQIYQLLLGDFDEGYIEFEARTHRGYGANQALYRGLLNAIKESVSGTLGREWTSEYETAWDRSIDRIVKAFVSVE